MMYSYYPDFIFFNYPINNSIISLYKFSNVIIVKLRNNFSGFRI